jgi:hypothetical protein
VLVQRVWSCTPTALNTLKRIPYHQVRQIKRAAKIISMCIEVNTTFAEPGDQPPAIPWDEHEQSAI